MDITQNTSDQIHNCKGDSINEKTLNPEKKRALRRQHTHIHCSLVAKLKMASPRNQRLDLIDLYRHEIRSLWRLPFLLPTSLSVDPQSKQKRNPSESRCFNVLLENQVFLNGTVSNNLLITRHIRPSSNLEWLAVFVDSLQ